MAGKNTKDLLTLYSQTYRTPDQVQGLLRSFHYNKSPTLASAETVLRTHIAHCLEGVFVAAALLEFQGYEPVVMSLESQDGLDHCLFIYQERGRWGAVGKSRDEGLNGRAPVFRTLAQLAWSYFDPYVDHTGRVTAWQIAHLDEVQADWRRGKQNVWSLENHLLEIYHHPIKSSKRRYQRLLRAFKKGFPPPRKSHWK
ncbi:MAG: hypothetical protein ACK5Y2_02955 [Bdellovibrionales bacterium]